VKKVIKIKQVCSKIVAMRKVIFLSIALIFPALAQEEIFGYRVLNEPLEPALASYIGRDVWAYGNLRVYCQNPINTQQVVRFYNTTPQHKLTIQNLVRVKLPEEYWQQVIHVNGGFTQPMDFSSITSETAFLLTLQTETAIVNTASVSDSSLGHDELYVSCQEFFTVVFPKINYLERIFSFESFQDVAREQGWSKKARADTLDIYTSVQPGTTKDMVLWKLGAPLSPLELDEALNASHWNYQGYIPFSKNVTFDKRTGTVTKYLESHLP
jgi:hypothetical protein